MVLQFHSIAPHILKKIAEQMEFADLVNLFESSRVGKDLGNIVTYLGVKHCEVLNISQYGVSFTFHKNGYWSSLYLTQIKEHKCWPRFYAEEVNIDEDLTNAKCREILKDLKEGHFLGKSNYIYFSPPKDALDLDVFNDLLEVTNAKEIMNRGHAGNREIDPIYLIQPVIQKMESVDWDGNFEDEAILGLQATTVKVNSISPNLKSTINTFFKQWLDNQRKIVHLQIHDKSGVKWSREDHDKMLSDLPFSTVWTPEIHSASPIAQIPLADIEKHILSIRDNSFHFVRNGEKFLFIAFEYYSECSVVEAKEVTDVNKELLEHLDEDSYRKLTGRCLGCKQEEEECTCSICGCCC